MNPSKWRSIPASFFAMVLGLVGLGDCWRLGDKLWAGKPMWIFPAWISEAVMAVAALVWIVLMLAYANKWLFARAEARAELYHPIQRCFIGLTGVSTMLIAVALERYSHDGAVALFVIGSIMQLGYGSAFTARAWRGELPVEQVTAALYLPTVAGNLVSAFVGAYVGFPVLGALFFGAGMFAWLALESVFTLRFHVHASMPKPLRPTMGIMLAPPAVACVGYMFITGGVKTEAPMPDLFAQAMAGYALLQFFILVRAMRWVAEQPFAASYWGYSFGVTGLSCVAIMLVKRGIASPPLEWLAVALFIVANAAIAVLIVGTVRLLLAGRLVPPSITGVVAATVPTPAPMPEPRPAPAS